MKLSAILNTTCSLVSVNVRPDFPDHASWNEVGGVCEEAEDPDLLLRVKRREWQKVLCEGEREMRSGWFSANQLIAQLFAHQLQVVR